MLCDCRRCEGFTEPNLIAQKRSTIAVQGVHHACDAVHLMIAQINRSQPSFDRCGLKHEMGNVASGDVSTHYSQSCVQAIMS